MDLGLAGWRVLVTGATEGIGKAIAELLCSEGALVVGASRTAGEAGPGLVAQIQDDLVDPEAPIRIVERSVAALRGLDALVCCAGRGMPGSLETADESLWDEGVNLNLLSVARLCRSALPHLRERSGRILVLTALSGSEPRPDHVVSNATKAGAAALAKSLSIEVASEGILVNCIAPGRVLSGQVHRKTDAEQRDAFARAHIPAGRFGHPEEVAPFAALLISPRNTYVTGQTIHVDGGMLRKV